MSNGDAFSDLLHDTLTFCFGQCSKTCPVILPAVDVTFRLDLVTVGVTPAGSGLYVCFWPWNQPAPISGSVQPEISESGLSRTYARLSTSSFECSYTLYDR